MQKQQQEWLTRSEAAAHARWSLRNLDRLIEAGRITKFRVGHRTLISREEVDNLIRSSAVVMPPRQKGANDAQAA